MRKTQEFDWEIFRVSLANNNQRVLLGFWGDAVITDSLGSGTASVLVWETHTQPETVSVWESDKRRVRASGAAVIGHRRPWLSTLHSPQCTVQTSLKCWEIL